MTLDQARTAILNAFGRMNAAYRETVFDEWILISIRPESGMILGYDGPRANEYKKSFANDVGPLRTEIAHQKMAIGDFAFATWGRGEKYDAFVRVGDNSYLFCNHTQKTMAEIRDNPNWLEAQKPFVELSETFRRDPLK
ncbi:MAG TPA: hypothetical protein VHD32_04100 [Candidatus Didemnitutus sp.]|nr:hypothetical protein [Candidatus Didemnitutus sp.]